MTDKQKIRRLEARIDFMESWLIILLLPNGKFKDSSECVDLIRDGCEKYLNTKFKYPINSWSK